jgi:hypothetical protein
MPITNFYHIGAMMKGTDFHDMEALAPIPPDFSLTRPRADYLVFCEEKDGDQIVATVTSDGKRMVKRGSDVKGDKAPHMLSQSNIWPPNPIKQIATERAIQKAATSKATMGIASVTGEKGPLATCLSGAEGANLNCTDQPVRSNTVKAVNSVRTNPTKQDYSQAFEAEFIEDHDIDKYIKGAPGPEPKRTVSRSERMKRGYEREKKDFDRMKKWVKKS